MNPGTFFREALESHEFRSSDRFLGRFGHTVEHTPGTSDNANLLDIIEEGQARRIFEPMLA